MTSKTMRKGFVWLIGALFALIVALLVLPVIGMLFGGGMDPRAHASGGDDIIQSNDQNTITSTSGDVQVGTGDSQALAFAHALGDVDIAQCLASTQWGTILFSKQKVVLNQWCAAEIYDAKGMHEMAALLRCDIEEIAKHFETPGRCIEANTWTPPPEPEPDPPEQTSSFLPMMEQAEEDHDEDVRELLARIEAIENRPAPAPRQQVEVNQTGITNEQRQAMAEVFEK